MKVRCARIGSAAIVAFTVFSVLGLTARAQDPDSESGTTSLADRLECGPSDMQIVAVPEYVPGAVGETSPEAAVESYLAATPVEVRGSDFAASTDVPESSEPAVEIVDHHEEDGDLVATGATVEYGSGYRVETLATCDSVTVTDQVQEEEEGR